VYSQPVNYQDFAEADTASHDTAHSTSQTALS